MHSCFQRIIWKLFAKTPHLTLAISSNGARTGATAVMETLNFECSSNRKYFGSGRGITYYNFTSDQFTGLHGLVVPGTLRDSLVLLVGLLEQKNSLHPREIMTDTAGYSDVIFGLFWLLGYQFSPRLADVGSARFWQFDTDADYGVLDKLSRQRLNVTLIEDHWDDLLRVAGSLKLGTVSALELMRVLQRSKTPSTLSRAIQELRRIAKTLYLLNYVNDEDYRRRILTQLNRKEGRHRLARAIFYGRKALSVFFVSLLRMTQAQVFYSGLKGKLAKYRRYLDDLKIMLGVFPVIGRTAPSGKPVQQNCGIP